MGPKGLKKTNSDNNTTTDVDNVTKEEDKTKAKRGRKSKKELMAALNVLPTSSSTTEDPNIIIQDPNLDTNATSNQDDIIDYSLNKEEQVIKKRGRKPKGGKIIQPSVSIESYKEDKPNVILHLKCSLKDIHDSFGSTNNVESFNFVKNDLGFDLYGSENINISNYDLSATNTTVINNSNIAQSSSYNCDSDYENDDDIFNKEKDKTKEIWRKLKQLEHNLHINNVNNKKSCCFWDTCDFDGPACYAPIYRRNGTIYVEGCFCCPQCAAAHIIKKPNIDNSTRFECLYLLNYLYGAIYGYTKNINPAPDPHYMLNKFLGNLNIQEYRSLLGNERLFLIVDKPLTRVLPELHEYNDEFILNNKIIPSNNFQLKARLQKKKQDKNSIMNEKFGINQNQICG
jgi:hypothetical protein